MRTPNADLAYEVLDYIDAHPEQWDQSTYQQELDGTMVRCFAGWAIALSGIEIPLNADGDWLPIMRDGQRVSPRQLASELLGLDIDRHINLGGAGYIDLFESRHSREDLGAYVAFVFGPRPARTPLSTSTQEEQS